MFFARFAFFVNNEKEQEKLLHFGQIIAAIPLIYVACFAQFHGEQLLFLFTKSTLEEKATILACLKVLFWACFTISIFSIFSTMLTATHHEKFVNRMIVAGILLNVGLNAYFIPIYGTIAAAWNTLANYIFLCICYVLYTHFRTNIKVPYWQTARLFILGAVCYFTFVFFQKFGLLWWQESFVIGILYLVFAFVLRLIPSPNELRILLKKT
jgi:O-antigen/teichoic acid export membrane protein